MRRIWLFLIVGLFISRCTSVSTTRLTKLGVKKNYSKSGNYEVTKGIYVLTPENLVALGRPSYSEGRIYFNAYDNTSKSYQIFSINSSGRGGVSQITRGDDLPSNPKISSDDKYLFYLDDNGKVWRIRKDGAGGKRVLQLIDQPIAAFDINGDAIVFSTEKQKNVTSSRSMIWTSNLDGGEMTQLGEGTNPSWSPDTQYIVYESGNDIYVMNHDGTNLINLTNSEKEYDKFPSFSPDGNKICYSLYSYNGTNSYSDTNIYIMNTDGTEKIQYTRSAAEDVLPLWSKDGKIYFISFRGESSSTNKILRVWAFTPDV